MKKYQTTSAFKRKFRNQVYEVLRELRDNEFGKPQRLVNMLVKHTLRQRSGHYMKKAIRKCYDEIPAHHRTHVKA